jgi:hypothetical protein
VFDHYTKKKARRSYQLLIFPPRSTHTLQPLDVGMFKPLSQAYSNELSAFLERSQGLSPIKKSDFFRLVWKARVSSLKETTILKSFEATGMSLFNLDAILKRFINTNPDKQGSRESSTSVLSGCDWRKIERLVKVAAKDINNEETKKLSRSLHSMSVQNELLKHENKGLREALANKRKHQKRGKPLDLQQRQEYHGEAVVWSPRKSREARAREIVKEREERELQLQKAERAELKKTSGCASLR